MRVALVHDWLNGMRGGEKVLQAIASIFPRSKIYTLFYDPETISADIKKHEIKTSFIYMFKSLLMTYVPILFGSFFCELNHKKLIEIFMNPAV